jgi:hypothetical protein
MMNERIKLLAEQAYDTVEYNYAPSKEFFNKQKFAELIIRECIGIVKQKWIMADEDVIAEEIKEHFGV